MTDGHENHENGAFDDVAEQESPKRGRGYRRTPQERDRDEMDKNVAAYERKLAVKATLEAKRDKIARARVQQLKALDEKLAPYEQEVMYLRKRVENFATITGDDVNDLLDPIDAKYFEYDELGVFSEENDKPNDERVTTDEA